MSKGRHGLKTAGRLCKDEFDADDVGPTRINHRRDFAGYDRDYHRGPVPYNMLKRYLKSQVGKPWTAVHAALSHKYDRRSDVGGEIWRHINREVEEHTFIGFDGNIYEQTSHGEWPANGFYVHPSTGLLAWAKAPSYRYNPPANDDEHKVDDLHFLRREDGIWYLFTYHMVEHSQVHRTPIYITNPLTREKVRAVDASGNFAFTSTVHRYMQKEQKDKHQLNHKQLKDAGLRNIVTPQTESRRDRARRKAA